MPLHNTGIKHPELSAIIEVKLILKDSWKIPSLAALPILHKYN
jgi:hypothetical protein